VNLLPAVLPKVRVFDVPLCGVDEPAYSYEPQLGIRIRDTIPKDCGRALVIVNGTALMQRHWHREIFMGDVVEWHIIPQGGQASRTILSIIAIIVISYFVGPAGLGLTGFQAAAATIALNLAATLLINAIIPIKPAGSGADSSISPGSTYNASLAGNQARLNQPIPVIYGRMRVLPDFACQPYVQYRNNDQYYYVLLCIGQGEYALESLLIDDTPISNFHSVYYRLLQPGEQPQQVKANIVTAIEVAGNTLEAGKPVGGFTVNKPRTSIDGIGWDIVADQGLGVADPATGAFASFRVQVDVDIQYVDDFGQPLGIWRNLMHCSITAASRTQQRRTYNALLPEPGRVSVRFTRTTAANESNLVLNTITLSGLRGRLTAPAPLCATATYLEIAMKANEQLNGLTQKKLATIVRRKLKTWNPTTGWDLANAESRSICWAIVDKFKNTVYGDRLVDNEIDLQGFYDLDQIYKARQDHLDILFDSRVTSKAANSTMAQVGRAIVLQRMGLFSITRDQYQALPSAAYTTRDIIPGSTSIGYALTTPESPDAISYEYFDFRSWDWVPILAKLPGVITPVNPITLRVLGISGSMQALREATYLAAQSLYRRKFPKWQVEMKGLLSAYGSAVIFSPALPGWGSPGDVVSWNSPGLVATLSEPPVWVKGKNHFITLEKSNGQLTIAIPVTPGPTKFDVALQIDPGFTPVTDDADSDRTKYVFGPEGQHQVIVRLTNIQGRGRSTEGNPIIEMSGVAENNLVHTADNAYLPAGGVIQDPVPTTTIDTQSTADDFGDGLPAVTLQSHVESAGTQGDVATNFTIGGAIEFRLSHLGLASFSYANTGPDFDSGTMIGPDSYDGEWLTDLPETAVVNSFEVYVSVVAPYGQAANFVGSPLDTWLNLGAADYAWRFGVSATHPPLNIVIPPAGESQGTEAPPSIVEAVYTVLIRRVGSTVNQANTTFIADIGYSYGSSESGSSGGDSGAGKIICTAMNDLYGLPYRENLIWLSYAKHHLTPAHERGYHAIFGPLVDYGFKQGDGWLNLRVRNALIWIGKNRTSDIKNELRGRPRNWLHLTLRAIIEPTLAAIGKRKQ